MASRIDSSRYNPIRMRRSIGSTEGLSSELLERPDCRRQCVPSTSIQWWSANETRRRLSERVVWCRAVTPRRQRD